MTGEEIKVDRERESPQGQSGAGKYALYQDVCERLVALLGDETNFIANAANTAAFLFHSLEDVNWVGFYLVHGKELVLGPFQGQPACVRIPFGKGVCGAAAESGSTVAVPDVDQFPGHITCDPASRSEIVVPLMTWGKLIGVLDIDSPTVNRFDEEDRDGLESVVSVLLASQSSSDLPDLGDEAAEC
ncbi:MAG: GAF domain-containing protein [Acidobacteriaceae bacterium]|nr:GAF domain-containing protein [Acidobacteriaceae bacterium]MBV9441102.1 GAF domain-containing protein [Acidobacteriaceae bacterium]